MADLNCSKCAQAKTSKDYNKEQLAKTAADGSASRICNDCGPPMPKDLSILTIVLLKKELTNRGVTDLTGKKAALVTRLQQSLLVNDNNNNNESVAAEDTKENAPVAVVSKKEQPKQKTIVPSPTTETLDVMSLKVVDLKKELKTRDLSIIGLKAVLQNRLAEAVEVECLAVAVEISKETSEVHCVVITKKNNSKSIVESHISAMKSVGVVNDENAPNGATANRNNWKNIAPKSSEMDSTKTVKNTDYHWCTKCKSWSASHKTTEHKSKKKRKNNRKKSMPLVPFAPIRTPGRTPNPNKMSNSSISVLKPNTMTPSSMKLIF